MKTPQPELEQLTAPVPGDWGRMTFPVYRHMLSLEPVTRHPEQGDGKLIQPIAIAARLQGEQVGLALGEAPPGSEGEPALLSLFTRPDVRSMGIATAMVAKFEEVLCKQGFVRVETVYMTGKPSIPAVERVLKKREWSEPATRTVTVRFTPDEALSTPWFKRVRLPEGDYEIFPWTELTDQERSTLKQSHQESPWIAAGLEPWRHDRHSFHQASSVGLRYKGEVVGWMINHQVSADTVRFTCSFMRKGLGRLGRVMPLYVASIKRLKEAGCACCSFVTPVVYPNMIRFIRRRCAPWAGFVGESRGSTKELELDHSH